MTELEILEWLRRITVAARYSAEESAPLYLQRIENELDVLIAEKQP